MKILDLKMYFSQGREIEFSLNGHNYFLQPLYDDNENKYVLYDCIDPNHISVVLQATVDTIMEYLFDGKYSFNNILSAFDFICVL